MLNIGRKEQMILLVLAAVIIFGSGYKIAENKIVEKPQVIERQTEFLEDEEKDSVLDKDSDKVSQETSEIFVHVSGAVLNPGIYELPEGARVNDALTFAVLEEDAILDYINLAQILRDEDKVVVPDKSHVTEGELSLSTNNNSDQDPFLGVIGSTTEDSSSSGKVNINTADEALLETLTGIGPVYAKNIVEYRGQQGSFKSIEEIKNVSGIGDKRFESLEDQIVVN